MRGGESTGLWVAALGGDGGEVVYEADLPGCCAHEARFAGGEFECSVCGASWQIVAETSPEVCAFGMRSAQSEQGAA
ncbi:Hypothetical Protein RradSPS_0372 [Rubrobacter radiotolerans]|uniref:Uncharacterized protein n=1 Tax=Rubrobacter radiotolerans TaxID=42256 RepID=A0A023X0X5_RUBRA|nr:hypothetical protein [Rubrobacter radiotolerans]AHY45655.1 Hypothetical Protein RradSPS_0372 [Rubrobacter radiotolerans]MDX5893069.1 hypothetical protein [Rubrobacter radiotolerans]SMC02999.1 conserved hypothetical protein [Rubrobacter radiotolerans DSM 5868]